MDDQTPNNDTPDMRKERAQNFLQNELAKMQAKVEQLTKDKDAVRAEFATCNDENIIVKTRQEIRGRMADALEILDQLLLHGSDGIRLNAAKYIIDRGLDPDKIGGINEEAAKLEKLLSELAK